MNGERYKPRCFVCRRTRARGGILIISPSTPTAAVWRPKRQTHPKPLAKWPASFNVTYGDVCTVAGKQYRCGGGGGHTRDEYGTRLWREKNASVADTTGAVHDRFGRIPPEGSRRTREAGTNINARQRVWGCFRFLSSSGRGRDSGTRCRGGTIPAPGGVRAVLSRYTKTVKAAEATNKRKNPVRKKKKNSIKRSLFCKRKKGRFTLSGVPASP